ncbi:MAG: DUF3037 domain-containing protein [Pseudomonadota bacterium]
MKSAYSLIQYAEDPQRLEFVNIGVVIFDEAGVHMKFADSPIRINKVFRVSLGDHYNILVEALESRIRKEAPKLRESINLEMFIANRSGNLRLTPLRSLLVREPARDLQKLFERLVDDGGIRQRRRRVDTKLRQLFRFEQVESYLDKPEKISIKSFTLDPDYGYQNGAYNFIKAVSLHGEPNHALDKVSDYAVRGKMLSESEPLLNLGGRSLVRSQRLVIVGDNSEQLPDVVAEISKVLDQHNVIFHAMDNMGPLLNDIRKNNELHRLID